MPTAKNLAGQALQYSSRFGGGNAAAAAAKENPEYAEFDQSKVNQIMKSRGISETDAKKAAVTEAYAKYDVPELKNMNKTELTTMAKLGGPKGTKALEQLAKDGNIGEFGDAQKISDAIKEAETKYGSTVRKSAVASMPELAKYGDGAQQYKNFGTADADAEELAVVDAWKGLSTTQQRDVKAENITAHALTRSVKSTLEATKQMNASQRSQYAKMTRDKNEINKALDLANQLQNLGRKQEADNIRDHLASSEIQGL